MDKNLNTPLDTDLENHLNKKFNYDELITLLNTGNDKQRQLAALELEEIKSTEDAKILVSNLTGQDGKIREAVAFRINELVQNPDYKALFDDEAIFATLLEGIMDINGNVCRNIVNADWSNDFEQFLVKTLPERIRKILQTIKELSADEKQYKISKRNFQLYWSFEALYKIISAIDTKSIYDIIKATSEFEDYTIREKTAKILSEVDDKELYKIKEKLKNDENYYVKRYLN